MRFIRWDRRQQRRCAFRPMTEQLESRALLSIEPTLLATFSTADIDQPSIDHFQAARDLVFFNVNDRELWVTDGRPEGTYRIADEPMVGEPIDIEVLDGLTLFTPGTDLGQSVWRSDGTPEGTWKITEDAQVIAPVYATHEMTLIQVLSDAGQGEVWRIDDQPFGSERITTLASTDRVSVQQGADGELFIVGRSLHVTDGTAAGTVLLHDNIWAKTLVQSPLATFALTQTADSGYAIIRVNGTNVEIVDLPATLA